MAIVNCMTHALKLETNFEVSSADTHFFSGNTVRNIDDISKKFHRSFRVLDGPSDILQEGEWLIAFIGFFPSHYDYEGIADEFDCHFMLFEDGVWTHRPGANADIENVPESEFTSGGSSYPVQYFAVRRVEE